MAVNTCYCGNTYEECECDPENKTFRVTDKSNKAIKQYFKSQIPNELKPYVEIAKKEYEEQVGHQVNLSDPKLPQYQRSAVMAKAMMLFLSRK
jgi:hypothetical protein